MKSKLLAIVMTGALIASAHAKPAALWQPGQFESPQAIAQCNVRVDNPIDPTLNARTRPNGPVLNFFGNGEIVNTYDRQGDWIYVEGAISDENGNIDKHGWVHGAYLRNCRPAAG